MVPKPTSTAATRSSSRVTAMATMSKTNKRAAASSSDDNNNNDGNVDSDYNDSDKDGGDYAGGASSEKVVSSVVKKQKTTTTATTATTTTTVNATVTATATASEKKPALAKKGSVAKVPMRVGAPVNTAMPTPMTLPPAPEGCIKITSWNVSGLNASLKKGFKTYVSAEDADVICLQEHKVNQPLLNLVDPKVYPFSWWGFESDKKGYAGVVMFSKTHPINVTAGLPTHPNPDCTKGRIVTLEYETCFLLGCYVPNAGQGLVRLKERMVWDVAMKDWLLQLKAKGKHIIWTGDLNVCHKPIDLRNPTTNTMSAGFTKEERAGFSEILEKVDLVDTFRELKGEAEDAVGFYSYFSYRFQCRVKGIGWRLDYFVTDKDLFKDRVVDSFIREEAYGASDHVPVVMVLRGAL
ncbi:hypothetical protein KVV02_000382 [Mortierella alpina]|uniref:DNA-(apurinic or apyrimidinic site) endonuclease n=1 Tax=Mortierella alpina TaxID=64518 RepID=A0A9P8CVI8_MORAP|nr:hypothetical protein KVV02_000382 [Mortierella alpina]